MTSATGSSYPEHFAPQEFVQIIKSLDKLDTLLRMPSKEICSDVTEFGSLAQNVLFCLKDLSTSLIQNSESAAASSFLTQGKKKEAIQLMKEQGAFYNITMVFNFVQRRGSSQVNQ